MPSFFHRSYPISIINSWFSLELQEGIQCIGRGMFGKSFRNRIGRERARERATHGQAVSHTGALCSVGLCLARRSYCPPVHTCTAHEAQRVEDLGNAAQHSRVAGRNSCHFKRQMSGFGTLRDTYQSFDACPKRLEYDKAFDILLCT